MAKNWARPFPNHSSLRLSKLSKVILLLVIPGFILISETRHLTQFPNSISKPDLTKVSLLWSSRIDRFGPEKAYDKFISSYRSQSFTDQHLASHVFGSLLYDKEGAHGIKICQSVFAYGCFHGFFSKAIGQQGLAIIPALDQACVERYGRLGTGCQHGIGHGIMEYLGPEFLIEALDKCLLTTQINPLFGCSTGVLMEYNLRTEISAIKVEMIPRKLDQQGPYFPCSDLPRPNYRLTCYYQQPQWWNRIFSSNFVKIGSLCFDIKDAQEQESCYLGSGSAAALSTDYETNLVRKNCQKMPSPPTQALCLAGATWAFSAEPKVAHLSSNVCADLLEPFRSQCLDKSDLVHAKSKSE